VSFVGFKSKISSKVNHLDTNGAFLANSLQLDETRTNVVTQTIKSNSANVLNQKADDEVSTRLFASVVSIVEDRRQLISSLDEHKRFLHDAENTIQDMKLDKRTAQLLIEKKEEEIEVSHRQVAEKQLKYDQLLEDYRQLRANDANEFERLQQQIKEIRLSYENLNSDYSRFRTESIRESEKLEAEVREGLVKHHQLLDEYNKLREENSNLMSSIVNFTQQMSSLRVPGQNLEPRKPVPIYPVVVDKENASGR
jgi:chromosome segregation ATPase